VCVAFEQLVAAYKEQVEGLLEGGAHVLLVETIFDTLNAKVTAFGVVTMSTEVFVLQAALFAIEEVFKDSKYERAPILVHSALWLRYVLLTALRYLVLLLTRVAGPSQDRLQRHSIRV
jgi:hypothetical protein